MKQLSKGQFYGETNFRRSVDSLTLTDTVYTHDFVDWHYHETPYFTFLLQGGLTEGYKKERKNLRPGVFCFTTGTSAIIIISQPEPPEDFIWKSITSFQKITTCRCRTFRETVKYMILH